MAPTPSANAMLDQAIAASDKLPIACIPWTSIKPHMLESDREGLSNAQVKERRASFGPNELSGRKKQKRLVAISAAI